MSDHLFKRVLGIDPYSRGVGFAVLEGGDHLELIDWGLKSTRRADSDKTARMIEALIARFKPDILALEDWESEGSRRCSRVQALLHRIASEGRTGIQVRLINCRQIRAIGPLSRVNTKYGRACFIAERFPELQPFVPPIRKIWMAEDSRMAIFDAITFAVACIPIHASAIDPPEETPA